MRNKIGSVLVFTSVLFGIVLFCPELSAQVRLACGPSGALEFTADGCLNVAFADGTRWETVDEPAFLLQTRSGEVRSVAVREAGPNRVEVGFSDGGTALFHVRSENGFALFRLEKLDVKSEVEYFEMGRIASPPGSQIDGTLGRARHEDKFAAITTAALSVRPNASSNRVVRANNAGCRHTFRQVEGREPGSFAAEFEATYDKPGADAAGNPRDGWSCRGVRFAKPLDLTGLKGIRAVIEGDAAGQSLKIQPKDTDGAARDFYYSINFTGWKECVQTESPHNKITKPGEIVGLNIYYNGMPAGKTVRCRIERIEAICETAGGERIVPLVDFADQRASWWERPATLLGATATARHGIDGAAFGVLFGGPSDDYMEITPRFEIAAGLPSPRFEGVWNKVAPDVRRSYFFLTNFKEPEFDDALAIAKRGGFDRILILQSSWTQAPGHYKINTRSFPDGLPGLARTVKRFQDAGFKTGFHFLAASIDPPDPYLTPVPDNRLFYGPQIELDADVGAEATFLPTARAPEAFPQEDGGYTGAGRVLRLGDELIVYTERKTEAPFGFDGCRRGHLGTKAAVHTKGTAVRHLVRAYGYHMIDLDTDLLEEVAAHFAEVADACNIDMMYFDGSERLQDGTDHWYYNARLQKAFYDAVKNKNMLMQGSSYSPYSWHQLARSASADGHGDLKGYLDQRSPAFRWMDANAMPLDIGWYYAYDVNCTIDMYEYILLATLAYDSSMSLQVSVSAAHRHPFIGELLDKIALYEKLRLSGRLSPELRERFKIDPRLGGKTPEEIAESFAHLRKEYRLLGEPGKELLQRVVYTGWQRIDKNPPADWSVAVPDELGKVQVGLNVHVLPEAKEQTLVNPWVEVNGKRLSVSATLRSGEYLFQWPGEASRLYAPQKDVAMLPEASGELRELSNGSHGVRFGAEGTIPPCRVRLTLQPEERISIP